MIFPVRSLDLENKEHTKFQFNWSTNYRDINFFKLIFICKLQKVPCALGFEVKRSTIFCRSSGHVK